MSTVAELIAMAVNDGELIDKRAEMPTAGKWPTRAKADILGVCVHQNAGGTNPLRTAEYHTSEDNHITPGRPLPSICYHLAIVDDERPWLVADPLWRTYAQGSDAPGDENRHLLAILVMGDFDGPGHRGRATMPLLRQMRALDTAIKWAQGSFGFGDEGLFGHYHFGKAACPGYALQEYVEARRKIAPRLQDIYDWQTSLLRWDAACLPKYGADGSWGEESKRAVTKFQRAHRIQVTGLRDPFTELLLLQRYSAQP
jgi:hypothetical protein